MNDDANDVQPISEEKLKELMKDTKPDSFDDRWKIAEWILAAAACLALFYAYYDAHETGVRVFSGVSGFLLFLILLQQITFKREINKVKTLLHVALKKLNSPQ